MKKIILLLALLATATLYSQSVEGNWYLPEKNDFRVFSIKGDSVVIYTDIPFDSVANLTSERIILSITHTEKTANAVQYDVEERKTGNDKATLQVEVVTEKHTVAYMKITKGKDRDKFNQPLRFITTEEIAGYAALKNLDTLTKEDFITLANHMINLQESTPKSGVGKAYLRSEMKYLLAKMGYNPLVKALEMSEIFAKFKTDPETQGLVDKLKI